MKNIKHCSKGQYIFEHDTIALPIGISGLPPTIEVAGRELQLKSSFHVSLVCLGEMVKKKPDLPENFMESVVEDFCDFVEENEILLERYLPETYTISQGERFTLIIMTQMSHIDAFFDLINEK